MAAASNQSYQYDVCFSFAGENRAYVEQVATELRKAGVSIFYDLYEQTNLWGKDLYVHLDEVYRHRAKYCVMFISEHYSRKLWTNHERRSAQARAFSENREYILPVRFDHTEVPGLPPTVGYLSLDNLSPAELASLIKQKLDENVDEEKPNAAPQHAAQAAVAEPAQSPLEKLQTYIVDDRHRIALYQLVVDQREALVAQLSEEEFPLAGAATIDDIQARMHKYEALVVPVLDFFVAGCRWSTPNQFSLWTDFIQRVADSNGRRTGQFNPILAKLRLYPALLFTYAAGIVCVADNRYPMLHNLFNTNITEKDTDEEIALSRALSVHNILSNDVFNKFPGYERYYVPFNEYLFRFFQEPLRTYFIDERRYETAFDRFEIMLALVHAHLRDKEYRQRYGDDGGFGGIWGPLGRFAWKVAHDRKSPLARIGIEAQDASAQWPPIAAGMFDGSLDRFTQIHQAITENASRIARF